LGNLEPQAKAIWKGVNGCAEIAERMVMSIVNSFDNSANIEFGGAPNTFRILIVLEEADKQKNRLGGGFWGDVA
jgi:hypothetical protein